MNHSEIEKYIEKELLDALGETEESISGPHLPWKGMSSYTLSQIVKIIEPVVEEVEDTVKDVFKGLLERHPRRWTLNSDICVYILYKPTVNADDVAQLVILRDQLRNCVEAIVGGRHTSLC